MNKNNLYIGNLVKNKDSVLVAFGEKTIFAQINGKFVNLADNKIYMTTEDDFCNYEVVIDYATLEPIMNLEKNVSKAYVKRILRKRS